MIFTAIEISLICRYLYILDCFKIHSVFFSDTSIISLLSIKLIGRNKKKRSLENVHAIELPFINCLIFHEFFCLICIHLTSNCNIFMYFPFYSTVNVCDREQ